jgi:hypothetical protein
VNAALAGRATAAGLPGEAEVAVHERGRAVELRRRRSLRFALAAMEYRLDTSGAMLQDVIMEQ